MSSRPSFISLPRWLMGVIPLVLLAGVIALFLALDPLEVLTGDQPPVPELSIRQVQLGDYGIRAEVVNAGRQPTTVAQVQVDEAYWSFEMEPDRTLGRLESATITIPYHWVKNEPHEVRLVTTVGATFSHEIEIATATPQPSATTWWIFGLVGFAVGVIPVGLGLMWFPLLQQLGRTAMNFILALTVGLLLYLLVDTVLEATEIAETVAGVYQALPMIFFAGLLSFLALVAVGNRESVADRSTVKGRRWVATSIALGIGLHNLGEGMAVGAAVAAGEAALGTFLVVGFILHNITEGVGIGAPMAEDEPGALRLVGLTLLAGFPAVVGTWVGGFVYSPLWAVVFLAIGAGAILQVVYEVGGMLLARGDEERAPITASWPALSGVTAGLAIMYVTALLV